MDGVINLVEHYLEIGVLFIEQSRKRINERFADHEAWQIILLSVGVTLILVHLYNFLNHPRLTIRQRFVSWFWTTLKSLPVIKPRVEKEIQKNINNVAQELYKLEKGDALLKKLPEKGLSKDQIFERIDKYYTPLQTVDWKGGRCSGTVYSGNDELSDLCSEVYHQFAWSNPLHLDIFPDVRRMEAEVVQMCLNMFHAGPNAGGTMTAGGTESILLAMCVYRDIARERGIETPELLAPVTAHAAFNKAAHYFDMRLISVPDDKKTHTVDVKTMRRLITKNTCVIVGSAPSFPFGTIDDIEEIAKMGKQYHIPVHVDCCLGGFLVPFMEKAGYPLPPFDFSLDGVTSISADSHKYGFTPKGSSIIMYSDRRIRNNQFFVATDWPGGLYATPTLLGSRAGAIIAASWATIMLHGEEGYVKSTKAIVETAMEIKKRASQIDGIFVFGDPKLSVVAFGSDIFDIFKLLGDLTHKGWSLNSLQFPGSFHICVTQRFVDENCIDLFMSDLEECTAENMKNPTKPAEGAAALYGTSQAIPDRSLITESARGYLDLCYSTNYQG